MKVTFGPTIGRELACRDLNLGTWAATAGVSPETASRALHGQPVTITSSTRLLRALRSVPVLDAPADVLAEMSAK